MLHFPHRHRGSNPLRVAIFKLIGRLAQLVERYPDKVDVSGSSPLATTTMLIKEKVYILLGGGSSAG